uniref:F-box domain-containing protein n=1 Tax=Peronospora matthiolae TaxID=2874970 RepID=A0AAV1VLH3_9STRA
MLQRTSCLVRHIIDRDEAQCALNRRIYSEVQSVLDEIVYDVESCEHACELERLRRRLDMAERALVEYRERENDLIQERQQAYEHAVKIEQEGRMIWTKVNQHMSVVESELAMKEVMETELKQAKEQLKLTGQLSKELAAAQREIRELRRSNDIQTSFRRNVSEPNSSVLQRGNNLLAEARSMSPELKATMKQSENVFSQIPDNVMLKLFSFLDEESKLRISVTDKVLVRRVNCLFGVTTPSTLAKSVPCTPAKQSSPRPQKRLAMRSFSFVGSSEKDKAGLTQRSKMDAIVKSLKPDQIKLFHDMSIRVKTLEAHLSQVQTEREDVAARLYNAESVRDFLMKKLTDTEEMVADIRTACAKKDEQAALDHEIIGFLDAKTQECESALIEYAHQNSSLRIEIEQLRESHRSNTTIIQDMVKLLTEEKKELEAQVRSQRKILVREVKVLRAQNRQLGTEKDHYFTQLKQLKHALQHLDELS